MGPFKIINKVIEVSYRLDLLLKIKIYLVYYIAMLEPVYKRFIEIKSKTNGQLKRYFSMIKWIVSYFIKFSRMDTKKLYRN